jgi:hypothetical protein
MKCYYHKRREAVKSCYLCGKSLCDECAQEVNGRFYCAECLEKGVEKRESEERMIKSPAAATLLSVIPGLGQLYNQEYAKAVAVMTLFVMSIYFIVEFSLSELYYLIPFLGIALGFIYFGGMVDAYVSAKRINERGVIEGYGGKGSLVLGIALMVFGSLFLFYNLGFDLSWLWDYWPILLLILGIYQITRYWQSRQ